LERQCDGICGILSIGFLNGCGGGEGEIIIPPTSTPTGGVGIGIKYLGSYATGCIIDGNSSYRESVTISALDTLESRVVYSDTGCTVPAMTKEITATYSYPGGTQLTSLGEADFINVLLTSFTENGVEVNVSVKPDADRTDFDIILLDGINLYLGDFDGGNFGNSAENRATTLHPVFYVRQ